jgi:hypothetical protein
MDFSLPCLIAGVCNMLGIHGKLLGRFRFCGRSLQNQGMVCRIALLTPEELPLGQGGIIDRLGCPIGTFS